MKRVVIFTLAALALLCCDSAKAWTCPAGQHWVQVPTGTKGGTVIQGITFQCQPDNPPLPPPPPSGGSNSNTNNNSNTNANNNSNNNSNSNKNSNDNSNLNSNTNSNKQNQSQKQSQGQTQSANSNATASATATSAATNNGNGSNNTDISTNIAASKIPVATAYAPEAMPTVTCFKGYSGGAQSSAFGISLGGGKIDPGCDIRETARSYALMGARLAACKVMLTNKRSQAAGVTLEDCLHLEQPVAEPLPVINPTPVIVNVPAPVIPTPITRVDPAPVVPVVEDRPSNSMELLGVCTFASKLQCSLPGSKPGEPTQVTSVCDKMLGAVAKRMNEDPHAYLKLVGNANASEREANTMYTLSRAENVKRQLVRAGVAQDRITIEIGSDNLRTVELWLVQ